MSRIVSRAVVLGFLRHRFDHVVICDFEYGQDRNFRPEARCAVMYDLLSGRTVRVWLDHVDPIPACPFPTDSRTLWCFYYSSGDLQSMARCGWGMPSWVLDIYVEYHWLVNNGEKRGLSVLDEALHFGLDAIGKAAKKEGRDLAKRGGPYSNDEIISLLDYCASDVDLEVQILLRTLELALTGDDNADWLYMRRAMNRGRYMKASALMEHTGISIKARRYDAYKAARPTITRNLVREFDPRCEIWDDKLHEDHANFLKWTGAHGIPWSCYPTGQPVLTDEYVKQQARLYEVIRGYAFVRSALKLMPNRREDLEIGADGFARCLLSAFRTKTGRTHPRASGFIFGRSVMERQQFLGPPPGLALAYLDYDSQELGVLAALSQDTDFKAAYCSGDMHLATAKSLGFVPLDGTADDYKNERKIAKVINFAILYGSGPVGLAPKIPRHGFTSASAATLINEHRLVFPQIHRWVDEQVWAAHWQGYVETCLGWRMWVPDATRPNTLRNWLIQATAGEITREAVCRLIDAGISVCCPVHDAVLIIAPEDRIVRDILDAAEMMGDASEAILGFRLRVSIPRTIEGVIKPVYYPDTLDDGEESKVTELIEPLWGDECDW